MTFNPSISSVARIAYHASNVLIESNPAPPATPVFAGQFASVSTSSHKPTVVSIPYGADPGSTLLRHSSAGLISYTTLASSLLLTRLVPHLLELSSLPLVLHLAIKDDISDVL